jgi:hypothetical protein
MRNIEIMKNNFKYYLKDYKILLKSKYNLIPYFFFKCSNYFPSIKLIELILHLNNYSLISYKYIYLKYNKIYRICQRKEIFNKNNNIKILHI